ncbi:hypothetical protein U1Q18_049827 [Sarracenia purpurea var. burkii]
MGSWWRRRRRIYEGIRMTGAAGVRGYKWMASKKRTRNLRTRYTTYRLMLGTPRRQYLAFYMVDEGGVRHRYMVLVLDLHNDNVRVYMDKLVGKEMGRIREKRRFHEYSWVEGSRSKYGCFGDVAAEAGRAWAARGNILIQH